MLARTSESSEVKTSGGRVFVSEGPGRAGGLRRDGVGRAPKVDDKEPPKQTPHTDRHTHTHRNTHTHR